MCNIDNKVASWMTCIATVHASGIGLPDGDESILYGVALGVQQGDLQGQRYACLPLGDV